MDTAAAVKEAFHIAGVHSTTIQPEAEGEDGLGDTSASDGENECLMRCADDSCEKLACCVPALPRLSSVDASVAAGGADVPDLPPLTVVPLTPAVVELTSAAAAPVVDVGEGRT